MAEVGKVAIILALICTLLVPTASYAQGTPASPQIEQTPNTVGFLQAPELIGEGQVPTPEQLERNWTTLEVLIQGGEWAVDAYAIGRMAIGAYQAALKAKQLNMLFWRTRVGTMALRGGSGALSWLYSHPLALAIGAAFLAKGDTDNSGRREAILREVDAYIDEYSIRLWDGYATDKDLMASAKNILRRGFDLYKSRCEARKLTGCASYNPEKIYLSRTPHASYQTVTLQQRYWVNTKWLTIYAGADRESFLEIPADVLIDPKPVEAAASFIAEALSENMTSQADPIAKEEAAKVGKSVSGIAERSMYFAKALIGYFPTPENATANYKRYYPLLMAKKQKQWEGIKINAANARLYNYYFRPITINYFERHSTFRMSTCEVENLAGLFYGGVSDCVKTPVSYFSGDFMRDVFDYYNMKELEPKLQWEKKKMAARIGAYAYVNASVQWDMYRLAKLITSRMPGMKGKILRASIGLGTVISTVAYDIYHQPEMNIYASIENVNGIPVNEELRVSLQRFTVQMANGEFDPQTAREELNRVLMKFGATKEDIEKGAREYRVATCRMTATWKSAEECERDAATRTNDPKVY